MTLKPATRTAVLCTVGIVVSLLGLFFLPPFFRQKDFTFGDKAVDSASVKVFPLDKPLELIPAPDASRPTASMTALKNLFGSKKTLIVNFWATWCPPCIEELPSLEYLNRQLQLNKDNHLPGLVTISVDEQKAPILALFKNLDFRPSFVTLHDKDAEIARSVGTTKFPETYWINAEGKILYKWVGPQNWLSDEVLRKLAAISNP